MIDENDRGNIASWTAVLLLIVLLESHIVRRPVVFLVGPFVVLIFVYIARAPIKKVAWLAAALISIAGFLLTRYVFR